MKHRIFILLKFLLGWPLSILALFFLFKLIAPQAPQFLSHFDKISYPLLVYGTISFLIYYFMRGYLWKRMTKQQGYDLAYKDTNYIWAASELQRYIPGNIWSFLGRSVRLAEKGMTKKDIAKCTLFELEFIVIGAATISLFALPFLISDMGLPSYLTPWILILFVLGIFFFAFHRKLRVKLFFLPDYPPTETLLLIFLNSISFFFFGLGYFLTFTSFIPIHPQLVFQLTGISTLSFLVGYLSIITPSGIGVREGALVLALSKVMPAATAGFVALFGRFILIIAEIIFVVISYLWNHAKNKTITKVETWIGEHKQLTVLLGLIVIYTIYFTTVSALRYDNFYTGKFDLGNMAQTVWNTTRGRIFLMTDANGTETVSRLSVHADFILILLAPLYALWSDPRNLLFIQTFILGIGALFVYLIANTVLKNKNIALAFAFAYLINPSIERSNLYDFHAQTLATTFLLGAFYFFMKRRFWYFLLFSVLAGLCKEQIWLIIGLFGIFLTAQYKKIFAGICLFICCVLISYFLISYAIPQALGAKHFALSYYSDFGDSPISIIKNILFSPQKIFGIISQPDRIDYLRQLFMPLGYLSLFGPVFLIFLLPDLAIDLLSTNTQLHQIYYQYTATITPFLFIAAIHGVALLKYLSLKWQEARIKKHELWLLSLIPDSLFIIRETVFNTIIIVYIVTVSFHGAYLYGPLPGEREPNLDMITKPVANKEFINIYLSNIKKRYSVAASNNIGSHLSQRQNIYILPLGVDKADIIVFLLNQSEYPDSLNQERAIVKKLLVDPRYLLTINKDEFMVFVKK